MYFRPVFAFYFESISSLNIQKLTSMSDTTEDQAEIVTWAIYHRPSNQDELGGQLVGTVEASSREEAEALGTQLAGHNHDRGVGVYAEVS